MTASSIAGQITSATNVCALLGNPVDHSVSPQMQNAAFRAARRDVVYVAFSVADARLPTAVDAIRAYGFLGANVTIPHKERVMPLLDTVDPLAEAIGAVNTIVADGDMLAGHNTDMSGAVNALKQAGIRLRNARVLVLGAGGSAKAVVTGLVGEHAKITLANRTYARAEALAASLLSANGVSVIEFNETAAAADDSTLIINCTPLGMASGAAREALPIDAAILREDMAVFDLVYNPLETPLLKAAAQAGATTISGIEMLVEQGAASFELWTGESPDRVRMRDAALAALRKQT